jgi:hypothetical protein
MAMSLYLCGVVLMFFAVLVPLRIGPGPLNELGEDIAASAFCAALWPFVLLIALISPFRK